MRVVAGVDCHKETHTVVFVDVTGSSLSQLTIQANEAGYAEAMARGAELGCTEWGLEGTGSYGRMFADILTRTGLTVYEVPGTFTKRHRKHASRHGKSDALDANAIAEAVLRESSRLSAYARSDEQEAVRLKYDRRDRLVRQRTEAVNRLRAAALRLDLGGLPTMLTSKSSLVRVLALLRKVRDRSHTTDELIAEVNEAVADIRRLNSVVATLERQLRPFVERLAPELLKMYGASLVTVAGLVGHGGILQCRNAAAFAMRAGVAPVECSSGRSKSVRINTGGDRQLNRALHVIALVQVRSRDHVGRSYYDRKRSEGKTHREAIRALKRQLATVVFYRLQSTYQRLVGPEGLHSIAA